jgi:hypothetical protein
MVSGQRHLATHELIEQGHGESNLTVFRRVDHPFLIRLSRDGAKLRALRFIALATSDERCGLRLRGQSTRCLFVRVQPSRAASDEADSFVDRTRINWTLDVPDDADPYDVLRWFLRDALFPLHQIDRLEEAAEEIDAGLLRLWVAAGNPDYTFDQTRMTSWSAVAV